MLYAFVFRFCQDKRDNATGSYCLSLLKLRRLYQKGGDF